ncbi:MAG TPA: VOC family protein [Capillimicrobium sp.]|jgi:catechol 2,3-dioxygenase-like lactoylglutathione lyase family enzyme
MTTMTDLHAGLPVRDLEGARAWYERFFDRPADFVAGRELLWEVAEHAWVFIDEQPGRAGSGFVTVSVTGLADLLADLTARGIAHEPVETYANGVQHVTVVDPDGNRLSLAQLPAA